MKTYLAIIGAVLLVGAFYPEKQETIQPVQEVSLVVASIDVATSTHKVERPKAIEQIGTELIPENIFKAVNAERIKGGAPILKRSATLDQIAMERAMDMVQNDYFSHTSPTGRAYSDFIFEGIGRGVYFYVGENLAVDRRTTQDIVKAWLKSPGHYENLIFKGYTETGIAVLYGKSCLDPIENQMTMCNVVVQLFGERK